MRGILLTIVALLVLQAFELPVDFHIQQMTQIKKARAQSQWPDPERLFDGYKASLRTLGKDIIGPSADEIEAAIKDSQDDDIKAARKILEDTPVQEMTPEKSQSINSAFAKIWNDPSLSKPSIRVRDDLERWKNEERGRRTEWPDLIFEISGISIQVLPYDPGVEEADREPLITSFLFIFTLSENSAKSWEQGKRKDDSDNDLPGIPPGGTLTLVIDLSGAGAIYNKTNPQVGFDDAYYPAPNSRYKVNCLDEPSADGVYALDANKDCGVAVGGIVNDKENERYFKNFSDRFFSDNPISFNEQEDNGTPESYTASLYTDIPVNADSPLVEKAHAAIPLIVGFIVGVAIRWAVAQGAQWVIKRLSTVAIRRLAVSLGSPGKWLYRKGGKVLFGLSAVGFKSYLIWGLRGVVGAFLYNLLSGCGLGLSAIFSGEFGEIFRKVLICIFQDVFRPIVAWAARLVEQAAGLSWRPRENILTSEKAIGLLATTGPP